MHLDVLGCGHQDQAGDSACLDFALSADPVDPTRVNVFERWARPEDLDAFRASGDPDNEPVDFSRIRRFEIEQYSVERRI